MGDMWPTGGVTITRHSMQVRRGLVHVTRHLSVPTDISQLCVKSFELLTYSWYVSDFWAISARIWLGDISRHNILQPPGCKGSWPQKPSVIRLEPAAGVFYLLSPLVIMSLAHHHHLPAWPQHWFTFNCSGSRHSILNYFSSSLLPSVEPCAHFFPNARGNFGDELWPLVASWVPLNVPRPGWAVVSLNYDPTVHNWSTQPLSKISANSVNFSWLRGFFRVRKKVKLTRWTFLLLTDRL